MTSPSIMTDEKTYRAVKWTAAETRAWLNVHTEAFLIMMEERYRCIMLPMSREGEVRSIRLNEDAQKFYHWTIRLNGKDQENLGEILYNRVKLTDLKNEYQTLGLKLRLEKRWRSRNAQIWKKRKERREERVRNRKKKTIKTPSTEPEQMNEHASSQCVGLV